ncbi:MAG: hypothetical protein HY716_17285 [Planctomycetes bacterium]|nr:hypothetical protein [Planctomycetota bacterium]
MTRMKKRLWIGAGALAGVLVIGLAGAVLALDPIVRAGVVKLSSDALKVPTRLESATVRLGGSARVDRFEISNPAGFSEPRAASFERFQLAVRTSTLFSDTVIVPEMTVVKPEMTIEFAGTKSNWSVLMDNLSEGSTKPDEPSDAAKQFRIEKLRVEGATVRFRSDLLGGGATSVTLPAIELKDIGTDEKAASMADVLGALLQALGSEALKEGRSFLPQELLGRFRRDVSARAADFRKWLEPLADPLKAAPQDLLDSGRKLKELLDRKRRP